MLLFILPELLPRHGGLAAVAFDLCFALPLLWRSRWPFPVFLLLAGLAFVQWLTGTRVLGDVALLIAFYTVASREDRRTTLIAAGFCSSASSWPSRRGSTAPTSEASLG